jgi:hypothetical protein
MDELPFGSLNLVVLEKRVWAASSQARDSAVALRRPLDSLNVAAFPRRDCSSRKSDHRTISKGGLTAIASFLFFSSAAGHQLQFSSRGLHLVFASVRKKAKGSKAESGWPQLHLQRIRHRAPPLSLNERQHEVSIFSRNFCCCGAGPVLLRRWRHPQVFLRGAA